MNFNEMFPARVLRGQDLTKPIKVQITGVGQDDMRAGQGKPVERKWVVFFEDVSTGKAKPLPNVQYFAGRGHELVLRKTLAMQIRDAVGAEPDEWAGKCVVLYPCGTTVQGKPAMTVCARAPKPVAVVEVVVVEPVPADVRPEPEAVGA